jgi:DNA modification methylase
MDFELIYEIGGNGQSCVFREYLLNSSVAARMTGEILTGHPSQKPTRLLQKIVLRTQGMVFDPFMGSGTTGVACARLGRPFVGIEIEPAYFDIACERIAAAYAQQRLFA